MRLVYIILFVFFVAALSSAHAGKGKIFYLYNANMAAFTGRPGAAAPAGSVDLMQYDLATKSRAAIIKGLCNATGSFIRFGHEVAVSDDSRFVAAGGYVWDTLAGKKRPAYRCVDYEQMFWLGNRYLATVPDDVSKTCPIAIYDAMANRKIRVPQYVGSVDCVERSIVANSIILAISPSGDEMDTAYRQFANGNRQQLFRSKRDISYITDLPDSPGFIYHPVEFGVLNYRSRSGKIFRLRLDGDNFDDSNWNFTSRVLANTGKMALLRCWNHGEPHIASDFNLYVVDIHSLSFTRKDSFSGNVFFEDYDLIGQLGTSPRVLIKEQTGSGDSDLTIGTRRDHFCVWDYDLTKFDAPGKLLFDSGAGCLDVMWHHG